MVAQAAMRSAMMHQRSVRRRATGGVEMDGDVPTTAAEGQQRRIGVGGLAAGFLVIGLLALAVEVGQIAYRATWHQAGSPVPSLGSDAITLVPAVLAVLLIGGAVGLWTGRAFGVWASWIVCVSLGAGAGGLVLLGLYVVSLTGVTFVGADLGAAPIPVALVCVGGACAAGFTVRALARTIHRLAPSFHRVSAVDALASAAMAALILGVAIAPLPVSGTGSLFGGSGGPGSRPVTGSQNSIPAKFFLVVTEVTVGSADLPNSSGGSPNTVGVVTSITAHLAFKSVWDLQLVGPLKLCLRYSGGADTSLPLCWGGDRITHLVNDALGAPAGASDSWVLRNETAADLRVSLDRDPASCDYPPGTWQLELFANSTNGLGQIWLTAPVDVPVDGPMATVGPKVTSEWLCRNPEP